MRTSLILLATAATAGAIGALAMRPKCGSPTVSTAAAAPRAMAASVPGPVAIASFATPAIAAAGRNVFAFACCHPERERGAWAGVRHDNAAVSALPAQPGPSLTLGVTEAPAANYLGSFGPQELPILVYKRGADVVNVPLRKP